MAIIITINLFIFDEGEYIHVWLGYLAIAIVLFRLIIGFTAKGYEAFKNFPLNLKELFYFLINVFSKKRKEYHGHNPVASYAFILFWIFVLLLGISGILLVHTDRFWGDPLMEDVHTLSSKAIIVFLAIHAAGIILDSLLHQRKTWLSMIKGMK